MRFAEVLNCLALKDFESRSLAFRSLAAVVEAAAAAAVPEAGAAPELDPAVVDPLTDAILCFLHEQITPKNFFDYRFLCLSGSV